MDREHAEPEFQTDLEASQEFQEVQQAEPLPIQRYFTDGALILAMAGGLELFCRIYGPYKRGFFCDDESIRYAYKENTISWFTLAIFVTLPNILLICAVESFRMHRSGTVHEYYSTYETGRSHSARLLIRLAVFHGYYICCIAVIFTLTSATKYPVGRLRPHFMDICRPNVGYDSCNTTSEIIDYYCTTGWNAAILEARLSFFSGHTSLSVGSATFAVIYLQDRLYGLLHSRVFVPICQTLYFSLALYIGYTRIFDHFHHWSDVMVGCVVGIVVMGVLCHYFVGLKPQFKPNPHEKIYLLSHHGTARDISTLTISPSDLRPNYGTAIVNNV